MSELLANLDRFTVLELAELLRAGAHALDMKLEQQLAIIRPPVVTTRVQTADMGEIYDSIGGDNALSRIDRIQATGGYAAVQQNAGN